jgi:hypothetical protein
MRWSLGSLVLCATTHVSSKSTPKRPLEVEDSSDFSIVEDVLHDSNLFHAALAKNFILNSNLVHTDDLTQHGRSSRREWE